MRKHAGLFAVVSATLIAGSLIASGAQAQNAPTPSPEIKSAAAIGKIESLTGEVKIEHATGVIIQASAGTDLNHAKVGDPVYQGDIVETGADSKAGIAFTDGTAFSLSSNARMTLDKYIYDPNGTSNSTFFNLSKGAFTFIAGKVARTGDMKISTPVATMGIRGTAPHVEISEDGSVKFSTLIEVDKNKIEEKSGTKTDPRRAQLSPQRAPANKETEKPLNLTICRGC